MSEDRERTLELITATQVVNADLYYTILQENAFLAKLMLDKLKCFLNNDYFATMERQTVLMKFLEEHTRIDVIQDVLQFINNCNLKNDYIAIIMEWTFHNSEKIKNHLLAKYDGSLLSLSKTTPKPEFQVKQNNATTDFVKAILQITTQQLNDDFGDDGTADV